MLRPTESVSLYQQIVGRGLRLSPGKTDCLVLDYAGNNFNLFAPEVGEPRPHAGTEPVQVPCPACGFANTFWGKTDEEGKVVEHYGRRCQGLFEDDEGHREECDYRFRAKIVPPAAPKTTSPPAAARAATSCWSIRMTSSRKPSISRTAWSFAAPVSPSPQGAANRGSGWR